MKVSDWIAIGALLIAISGFILAYAKFYRHKKEKQQTSATIVVNQILSIEKVMEELNIISVLISHKNLPLTEIYKIPRYTTEAWKEHNHNLVKRLPSSTYKAFEEFFTIAKQINIARDDIESLLRQEWNTKINNLSSHIANTLYDSIMNNISQAAFDDKLKLLSEFTGKFCNFSCGFTPYYVTELFKLKTETFEKISGTTHFSNLKKMSFLLDK
ncbi:MAG: hypothetical protein FWE03_05705 [Firmicutes bacterium]|nr:hypothetical protein [Bacillota bacterium]